MVRIASILVLLMCMLNLIPPLFAKGGIFNTYTVSVNECGNIVINEAIYFDNVYFSIFHLLIAFLGLTLPFLVSDLPKILKVISTLIGSWFISGLINGIVKMSLPAFLTENPNGWDDNFIYIKFMITFTTLVSFLFIENVWKKHKN